MNYVSRCCLREIVQGSYHENPLGSKEYNGAGITYLTDICSCCGIEIDEPLEVTECCGEETCSCVEEVPMAQITCESCHGTGINYTVGLDPDWCGNCGGAGIDWVPVEKSSIEDELETLRRMSI